jgi:hypothetical protein
VNPNSLFGTSLPEVIISQKYSVDDYIQDYQDELAIKALQGVVKVSYN